MSILYDINGLIPNDPSVDPLSLSTQKFKMSFLRYQKVKIRLTWNHLKRRGFRFLRSKDC